MLSQGLLPSMCQPGPRRCRLTRRRARPSAPSQPLSWEPRLVCTRTGRSAQTSTSGLPSQQLLGSPPALDQRLEGTPPPYLAPHSAHPGRPTLSASLSPRRCRGQGLCLDLSLGLWVSQPPGRAPAGMQRGPRGARETRAPSSWAPRSRPQPPAAPHGLLCRRPGVWTPTLCGWGLGAKGWAESAPLFVPLRERGTEWDEFRFPGPCAVFRSVSAGRAVL